MKNTSKTKMFRKKLKIVFLLSLFCIFFSISSVLHSQGKAGIKTVNYLVKVISGTYQGKIGFGSVTYDVSQARGINNGKIKSISATFTFLGQTVSGMPEVLVKNGKFKDLLWVTKIKNPQNKHFNFGFNTGFSRSQFSRNSERFIKRGKSYFGYLSPSTYVDGAGTITYSN